MVKNVESLLKRCLKRKIKITTAVITTFMITGGIVYANEVEKIKGGIDKPGSYKDPHYIFSKNDEMKNGNAIAGEYRFENDKTTIQMVGGEGWRKGFSVSDKEKMTTLKFKGDAEITNLSDLDSMFSSQDSILKIENPIEKAPNKSLVLNNSKKVESGIEASAGGGIFINGFDKVEIKADPKSKSGKYEFGIKAKNKGVIHLTAEEEVNIKDAKNTIYADGVNSKIEITSKDINLSASNEKDDKNEGSHGIRATNYGTVDLVTSDGKINIKGDKKNNKYFYKRSGILAENGGEVKLKSGSGINIDAYRGIDTKVGYVNGEVENGDIIINSEENGIYSGKFENKVHHKNGVALTAKNGNININSKKSGITSVNRTNTDITEVKLVANDITIKANSGNGIISGGKAKTSLLAKENILIDGSENGLYSDEGFVLSEQGKKLSNIDINSKKATIKSSGINSNSAIFAEGKSKIDLNIEDELNIQSFMEGSGVKIQKESEVIANSKNKLDIKSNKNSIETLEKSMFLGTAKNINIDSGKTALENKENSKITLKGNKISIFGDIFADDKSTTKIEKLSEEKGNVEIALSKDEIKNYRENKYYPSAYNWALISSETNANINLELKGKDELNNGSLLIGQIKDNIGTNSAGKISLNMDKDSIWVPRKANSVTNLNLNGGTIDLAKDKESSVHIENLKGQGTFNIFANTKDKSKGNMVYIQNFDSENKKEISENKLNIQDIDLRNFSNGEKIRFATLGEKAKDKVIFKGGVIEEKGIQNVDVKVLKENFDINDEENKNYKDSVFEGKYGFENYKNGENWYITREENVKPNIPPVEKPEINKPNVPPVEKPEINKPNVPPVEKPEINKPNVPPVEKPEVIPPQVKPNKDNDITKTILEMSKANYASAVYMDNLNKRLGDISFANGADGVWVRLRNDRVGEDNEYRLKNYMTQVGYDQVYFNANGEEHIGIAFDYTKGGMDYKNINGKSHLDKYSTSIYDTRLYNNGIYTDVVAKLGYMKSDFDITTSNQKYQVNGKYDNFIFGISGEIGEKIMLNKNLYFEPQIQLQYTYVDDADYTTNQGTKVQLSDINSLIGRVGFRVGHDFYNTNKKDNTIYFKADVNHEFLGDQTITASDLTGSIAREQRNINTWVDLGFGVSKDLTDNFNVYTDIEKQFRKEKDDKSWQMNLGFRYKFDKISDMFSK